MVREVITVSVGQCGNQIGRSFWYGCLREHAYVQKNNLDSVSRSESGKGVGGGRGGQAASEGGGGGGAKPYYDEAFSSFFTNVNSATLAETNTQCDIEHLRARAVLVDSEECVLDGIERSEIGELFSAGQIVGGTGGCGNNVAKGYYDSIDIVSGAMESIRKQAEKCSSLQAFVTLHSLQGGTGSGVGTKVMECIRDEYDGVFNFSVPVVNSEGEGDVVTGPYNSVSCRLFYRVFLCLALPFLLLFLFFFLFSWFLPSSSFPRPFPPFT